MPAYEFDEIMRPAAPEEGPAGTPPLSSALQAPGEKLNFWGYTKGHYFAPKYSYSATKDPVREFKTMVRAFHETA